jgi:hypothetical protein
MVFKDFDANFVHHDTEPEIAMKQSSLPLFPNGIINRAPQHR